VPKRAANAEAALIGKPWAEATIRTAMAALMQDFQPLSDWRGSAEYRLATAQNLLLRFFLENSGAPAATRVTGLASLAHG
jgi:xanthine dehydrogenase small subunit